MQQIKKDVPTIKQSDYRCKAHLGPEYGSILDPELQKRLEVFHAKLHRENSFFKVTSLGRTPATQDKWHLARMVTWGKEGKLAAWLHQRRRDPRQADRIYKNAIDLLQGILAHEEGRSAKALAVTDVIQRAAKIRDDVGFEDHEVAAGYKNCQCGCGMGRTKHLYRDANDSDSRDNDVPLIGQVKALDGNIFPLAKIKGGKLDGCNCRPDKSKHGLTITNKVLKCDKPESCTCSYHTVQRISKESNLVWGGMWQTPDKIHWQLPNSDSTSSSEKISSPGDWNLPINGQASA